jgi:hypothetical protein
MMLQTPRANQGKLRRRRRCEWELGLQQANAATATEAPKQAVTGSATGSDSWAVGSDRREARAPQGDGMPGQCEGGGGNLAVTLALVLAPELVLALEELDGVIGVLAGESLGCTEVYEEHNCMGSLPGCSAQ